MTKISLVILLMLSSNLFAKELYKISGKHYSLKKISNVLVNEECKECVAVKKVNALTKFKKEIKDRKWDMDLGSYVCKYIFIGKSVLGVDSKKNMKAFCYFDEDKSFIEMSSLTSFSEKFIKK